MTREEIKDILSESGKRCGLRELSFLLLCRHFDDPKIAYRVVYKPQGDVDEKEVAEELRKPDVKKLKDVLDAHLSSVEAAAESESSVARPQADELSGEDIRTQMEKELKILTEIRDTRGTELEAKEYATLSGRIADILVKLKEKFGTNDRKGEQRIVVLQKFNDICPYCHREISIEKESSLGL